VSRQNEVMRERETYVLRNWRAMAWAVFLLVFVAFITISPHEGKWWWILLLPLLSFVAAARQKVVLDNDGIELVDVFRHRRLSWHEVEHINVVYTRLPWKFGWSIRLHHAAGHHDTFLFMDFSARARSGMFSLPPRDAPKRIKELHAVIVACLNQLGRDPVGA
jgi:hypothetical protein